MRLKTGIIASAIIQKYETSYVALFIHLACAFVQSILKFKVCIYILCIDIFIYLATVVIRGILWANEKMNWTVAQWSKVFFSDESKFCISFGNQGPRVWRKGGEAPSPSCLKSSVKFPQSVMIWGAMSSAGVGPLCFLKTNVTAPAYQEILEHFMLPSADQLFKDADFIFQQDLAPAHTAKSTKSWLNDHGVGVLDWPVNSPDLNPIENLLSRGK